MKRIQPKDTVPTMHRMPFAAATWLLITSLAVSAPVTLRLSHGGITLSITDAFAKDGNGNGKGGGNGGDDDHGKGGDNGKSGDNGKGNDGRSSGKNDNARQSTTAASGAAGDDTSSSELSVRHAQGITEAIVKGRYVMKDARGRTIANRPATIADRLRIFGLLH